MRKVKINAPGFDGLGCALGLGFCEEARLLYLLSNRF